MLLLVALLTIVPLERKSARSYSNAVRAELALESGFALACEQMSSFLIRPEVGGASFTTWQYNQGEEDHQSQLLALTAGRPQLVDGTSSGALYLNNANTIWLGTVGESPDALYDEFKSADSNVIDLNLEYPLRDDDILCLARWQNLPSSTNGQQLRFAVWIEDETSRLDISQIGRVDREDGLSPAEIPFFGLKKLEEATTSAQIHWKTPESVRTILSDTDLPQTFSTAATAFSHGYNVLTHAPIYSAGGISEKNGFQLPLRGTAKRNLNWNGHLDLGSSEERVERLTEWITHGSPGFFAKRSIDFWSGANDNEGPKYKTLSLEDSSSRRLRSEQIRTIAASIIDYLDSDSIPTQPDALASLDYGNPAPGGSPVLLMSDIPRPKYFGADRNVRINEVQTIWNSRGLADNFEANVKVDRTDLGGGLFRYKIPVTYQFELWNMDQNSVPPSSYEIRTTFMQQILGPAFGTLGTQPIPEETELLISLNSGNPISFLPNELKEFTITRNYVRTGNQDRGTTWNSFRETSAGGRQPDGHTRQAHVLLDAESGKWLSSTGYTQMSEAPVNGLISVGPGNRGASKGNQINDPRMSPLRMYIDSTSHSDDRDWAGNKPGNLGFVNNSLNGFDYQNFNTWMDRPQLLALKNPLQGVTRVENRPMRSIGELGRIFDPSWTHPAGRGSGSQAYHKGNTSPFRGGGSLAIGQQSKATTSGLSDADHLEAKPWTLMDIFSIQGNGNSMTNEEYAALKWRGRVNLNCFRKIVLSDGGIKSNHELLMDLPNLRLGESSQPNLFNFNKISDELKGRLTKGTIRSDGEMINSWKKALPLFSPGQLSDLESWNQVTSFSPIESIGSLELKLVNRSDAAREEAMMRCANLVSTRSHCYRFIVVGEVIGNDGKPLARSAQERVIFFNCKWNHFTGELESIVPEILYVRAL